MSSSTQLVSQMRYSCASPGSGIAMGVELASAPRKSGIRVTGEMSWGTHICAFYEAEQDLLETNASYFAAGLGDNEFCI
jgi:hypothetical protein